MKLLILVLIIVGISCIVSKDDYDIYRYKDLKKEHQYLMEGQKKLMECIKMSFDKNVENGKKLDILLNIATNRVDNMVY